MKTKSMDEKARAAHPFDIELAFERVRKAVEVFPKAGLFELAEEGFNSAFELLVACIISIRTRDEVSLSVARRLFHRARTPVEVSRLEAKEIDDLIRDSAFHEAKALQILEIARRAVADFNGVLPCEGDVLLSFRGVGPKCANLVLGIACGEARIGVDIHVHRIANRWGYVSESMPERTMAALEAILPHAFRVEINSLLVPFGKHVCTGRLPRCSTCPVLDMCRRAGVEAHR